MATRQTYYAESNGESTTTASTDQDKVTLTFTPDDNSTYYFIGSAFGSDSTVSSDVRIKLVNNAGTAFAANTNQEPKDITDYISFCALGREVFTTGHGSQTYKIQYSTETATTTTAGIKEARLLAIKHATGDQYAESTGTTNTASATPTDKVTLTFTPASQGDYIIIGKCEYSANATSNTIQIQMDVDGSTYGLFSGQIPDNTNWFSLGIVKRVNLTAASHTIKIQIAAPDSATVSIRDAKILALRADTFDNNYYAEDTGADTTTSGSYVDGLTLTQTPQAKEHIILASAHYNYDSNGSSAFVQFLEGATTKGESPREPRISTLAMTFNYFTVYRKTLAASSTTWKFQYYSEVSPTQTTTIDEQAISIIQTEASSAGIAGNIFESTIFTGILK